MSAIAVPDPMAHAAKTTASNDWNNGSNLEKDFMEVNPRSGMRSKEFEK